MKCSTECFFRIYDDDTGYYVEVREDRDSLGLVEIAAHTASGSRESAVTMPVEQAALVAQAVQRMCNELEKRS